MADEQQDRLVKIHTIENRFEADQIGEALQRENIPFWIKSHTDTAYDGIYVSRKGWGDLWVPADREAEAKEIVAEFTQTLADDS
jgi:hypothetical protein